MIPDLLASPRHLVHEVAVLADPRRRAGLTLMSAALEEWHRHSLPCLLDRLRGRLRSHCDDGHQEWPGRSRHTQHTVPATPRSVTAATPATFTPAFIHLDPARPASTPAQTGRPRHRADPRRLAGRLTDGQVPTTRSGWWPLASHASSPGLPSGGCSLAGSETAAHSVQREVQGLAVRTATAARRRL